jgi:hypothetical protein
MVAKDKKLWREVSKRITSSMAHVDYLVLIKLHAKYFNHKYYKLCTCNKELLRTWIEQLNEKAK